MQWVSFIPSASRRIVLRAAQYDTLPVLVSGESGSGKGGIARWIHKNSPRSKRPLVEIRADTANPGQEILRSRGGSILFLDVEKHPESTLQLLGSVLKTRSLPGTVKHMVLARVLVTSATPIADTSPFYEFFENFSIHMPPLRDRRAEMDDIAQILLQEIAHDLKKDHVKSFDRYALETLRAYEWPGNLRELRNALRLAVISTQSDRIEREDLPELELQSSILRASREAFERAMISEVWKSTKGNLETSASTLRMEVGKLVKRMEDLGISDLIKKA